MKSLFSLKGLFLSCVREKIRCFKNLPVFSLVEAFLSKNKFFNFFVYRAEKIRIFAPLIEKRKKSEND